MSTQWKAIAAISETDDTLLLMTVRQEYEVVVSRKGLLILRQTLNELLEQEKITKTDIYEWDLLCQYFDILLNKLDGFKGITEFTFETPWQPLPIDGQAQILDEMLKIFGSNIYVSLVGTMPDISIEYRFGTYVLTRKLIPADLERLQQIVTGLNNVPEAEYEAVLLDISKGNLTGIAGLNKLAGGVDLAGGPLGGLAISLVVAASRMDSTRKIEADNEAAIRPFNAVVDAIIAIAFVAVSVGRCLSWGMEMYKNYQEAEKARLEKEELQRKAAQDKMMDDWRREGYPKREGGDMGAGGPADDAGRVRAAGTC